MARIGIIGGGAFGALLARMLSEGLGAAVVIYDSDPAARQRLDAAGFLTVTALADLHDCAVLVLAVPWTVFTDTLTALRPVLRPGMLVVDVCSVKLAPMQALQELLPAHVDYVGTHPLFGPQSARHGWQGLELVVCGGRGRRAEALVRLAGRRLGLRVVKLSADAHDRHMAWVQGLTHLLGRSVLRMGLDTRTTAGLNHTRSYTHLLELTELLKNDSVGLFRTIQLANPHTAAVREHFKAALGHTLSLLETGAGDGAMAPLGSSG